MVVSNRALTRGGKRKRSHSPSFEAVLNCDPARFLIGPRMTLKFLQGQERRVTGRAGVHANAFGRQRWHLWWGGG